VLATEGAVMNCTDKAVAMTGNSSNGTGVSRGGAVIILMGAPAAFVEKPVLVPLNPPQISPAPAWDRT
jgi:hypothetical protein